MGHEILTCKVFIGLSQKDEAKLFSKQNEFRRSITAFAQFRAEVVAEMEPAISIKNLCDKYHIEIKQARGMVPANTITSVRKLYNIVNKFGIKGLDFTLQTIIELGWNKMEAGMNEKVLSIYVAYLYCKGNATNYSKLKVCITEGKNRELRRFFAHFGREVLDLKRISYGFASLNALPCGKSRFFNKDEYKALHQFMKQKDLITLSVPSIIPMRRKMC